MVLLNLYEDDEEKNTPYRKIIASLKEEQSHEIKKIVNYYDKIIEDGNFNDRIGNIDDNLSNTLLIQINNLMDLNK